jgi:hypothetical protein
MPTSWESTYARKMAFFYKHRNLLQATRADRVVTVKREIAELENAVRSDLAAHEAGCGNCRKKRFCLKAIELSPHHSAISERLTLLAKEEADAKYAERSRQKYPEGHCDGYTAYWQNLRFRRFALADFKCETDGCDAWAKDLHHVHYDTYGFEELDDVRALCRSCHRARHGHG